MESYPVNYTSIVEDALRSVVKDILVQVQEYGLSGDQHFYISFRTDDEASQLSERLKEHHPSSMTIVLQHQFWDLEVVDLGFQVKLRFNAIDELIFVPFMAITAFADPSAQFGLQFGTPEETVENEEEVSKTSLGTDKRQQTCEKIAAKADIVNLNEFRKK